MRMRNIAGLKRMWIVVIIVILSARMPEAWSAQHCGDGSSRRGHGHARPIWEDGPQKHAAPDADDQDVRQGEDAEEEEEDAVPDEDDAE